MHILSLNFKNQSATGRITQAKSCLEGLPFLESYKLYINISKLLLNILNLFILKLHLQCKIKTHIPVISILFGTLTYQVIVYQSMLLKYQIRSTSIFLASNTFFPVLSRLSGIE